MIENNKPIENQNDFNPNMLRYVETFEEETEIDLMAVRREQIKLKDELELQKTQMEGFL